MVTANVSQLGSPVSDADSVTVTSTVHPGVLYYLADDGIAPDAFPGDGNYAGYFEIGGTLGEARPTGNYVIDATAYRDGDTGSDSSPSFSLYSVRRWTGVTTAVVNDPLDEYTDFAVSPNEGDGSWHHRIEDFGLIRSSSVSNAKIRLPILPQSNTISNLSVTGTGVSQVAVNDNVIEFVCDLTSGSVRRVTIEFDAPSDLCATYIDRYHTGDIGQRSFRNGYEVWNRYISTGILGTDHSYLHGSGCIVDLQVTDLGDGEAHTVDCMERVAVHLDDSAFNDGTGTYPSNIKWSGDSVDWLDSGDLESMTFVFPSGGNYGLRNKVDVIKTVQFFSDRRFFRHEYEFENIDAISHDFDFVWGREQWLYGSQSGSNRQEDDRGLLPNDGASYGGERGFLPGEVDGNWFASFDETSHYSIGVICADGSVPSMPTRAYFLCNPALGNFTGEYPIQPSGSCSHMENLFFEKGLGILGPGGTASYEFYQWGGYGFDRDDLTTHLWQDAVSISGEPLAIEFGPLGDEVPVTTTIEFRFNNPMNHNTTEAALVLSPPVPAGGSFVWSDGDTHLAYYPPTPLDAETIYEAELHRSALDDQGRPLATAAHWYFETGEATDVPSGGGFAAAVLTSAPNPFLTSTTIRFATAMEGKARLSLYNVRGQLVKVLIDDQIDGGEHSVDWSGRDSDGKRLGSGVYFARLEAPGTTEVRKIVIGR